MPKRRTDKVPTRTTHVGKLEMTKAGCEGDSIYELLSHPEKPGVDLVVALSLDGEMRSVLGEHDRSDREHHYYYRDLSGPEKNRLCRLLAEKRKSQ